MSENTAPINREAPVKIEPDFLKTFISVLNSTNEIRRKIENGEITGNSEAAFETIWQIHAGASPEEQATAWTEGGNISKEAMLESIAAGKGSNESLQSIRLVENEEPMLFDLPEPIKTQVAGIFFQFADQILKHPEKFHLAFIPAVELQTHLNFIHPKLDGNGRTSEDWMLWWQKELVKHAREKTRKSTDSHMAFLGITPTPSINEDSLRSWYHHGLRARYGGNDAINAIPPFLKKEYAEKYVDGRMLMASRTLEMNNFRRTMYKFLSEKLNYEGEPEDFEKYLVENSDQVVTLFQEVYSDTNNLDSFSPWGFHMTNMYDLLNQTGKYQFEGLTREQIIKKEYL